MPPYRLAAHVHGCFSNHGAVLLDLRNDAYVGLDITQSLALRDLVQGWPRSTQRGDVSESEAQAFALSLHERGLLAHNLARERPALPATLPPAERQLLPWDRMTCSHIRVGHVLAFTKALVIVALLLGTRSIFALVRRAQERRARNAHRPGVPDVWQAKALISAFYHIRAFFYGNKNRCLLDSAVLMEFLASYSVYPAWVIGVRVVPFAAHSWVQHEECVLNGTPEYVRAYEPILVI